MSVGVQNLSIGVDEPKFKLEHGEESTRLRIRGVDILPWMVRMPLAFDIAAGDLFVWIF